MFFNEIVPPIDASPEKQQEKWNAVNRTAAKFVQPANRIKYSDCVQVMNSKSVYRACPQKCKELKMREMPKRIISSAKQKYEQRIPRFMRTAGDS